MFQLGKNHWKKIGIHSCYFHSVLSCFFTHLTVSSLFFLVCSWNILLQLFLLYLSYKVCFELFGKRRRRMIVVIMCWVSNIILFLPILQKLCRKEDTYLWNSAYSTKSISRDNFYVRYLFIEKSVFLWLWIIFYFHPFVFLQRELDATHFHLFNRCFVMLLRRSFDTFSLMHVKVIRRKLKQHLMIALQTIVLSGLFNLSLPSNASWGVLSKVIFLFK